MTCLSHTGQAALARTLGRWGSGRSVSSEVLIEKPVLRRLQDGSGLVGRMVVVVVMVVMVMMMVMMVVVMVVVMVAVKGEEGEEQEPT